jgi:hypothetical protein
LFWNACLETEGELRGAERFSHTKTQKLLRILNGEKRAFFFEKKSRFVQFRKMKRNETHFYVDVISACSWKVSAFLISRWTQRGNRDFKEHFFSEWTIFFRKIKLTPNEEYGQIIVFLTLAGNITNYLSTWIISNVYRLKWVSVAS